MRRLLAPLMLFTPGTAFGATGEIGCIEAKLGSAAMQRIGDGLVSAVDNGAALSGALDAERDMLIAARNDCRRANAWSVSATDAALSYTQARAAWIGADSALKADGVDRNAVATVYAALPAADRRSFTNGMSSGAARAVGELAATRGNRAAVKRHIVMLLSALSGIEFYPAEFTKS